LILLGLHVGHIHADDAVSCLYNSWATDGLTCFSRRTDLVQPTQATANQTPSSGTLLPMRHIQQQVQSVLAHIPVDVTAAVIDAVAAIDTEISTLSSSSSPSSSSAPTSSSSSSSSSSSLSAAAAASSSSSSAASCASSFSSSPSYFIALLLSSIQSVHPGLHMNTYCSDRVYKLRHDCEMWDEFTASVVNSFGFCDPNTVEKFRDELVQGGRLTMSLYDITTQRQQALLDLWEESDLLLPDIFVRFASMHQAKPRYITSSELCALSNTYSATFVSELNYMSSMDDDTPLLP